MFKNSCRSFGKNPKLNSWIPEVSGWVSRRPLHEIMQQLLEESLKNLLEEYQWRNPEGLPLIFTETIYEFEEFRSKSLENNVWRNLWRVSLVTLKRISRGCSCIVQVQIHEDFWSNLKMYAWSNFWKKKMVFASRGSFGETWAPLANPERFSGGIFRIVAEKNPERAPGETSEIMPVIQKKNTSGVSERISEKKKFQQLYFNELVARISQLIDEILQEIRMEFLVESLDSLTEINLCKQSGLILGSFFLGKNLQRISWRKS